jgi:hypothetical protein
MFTEYEPIACSKSSGFDKRRLPALPSDPGDSFKRRGTVTICLCPCSTFPRRLEDTSEEFTGSQIGIKKGVWGESRFDFESIVEEVRRFVARMPPADSTTGLACCLRSFSALGDQRAEILPVQRPPTLAVGEHYMMRLARILIFPFFSLSIMDQLPLVRCLPKCPENFLETFAGGYTRLTG